MKFEQMIFSVMALLALVSAEAINLIKLKCRVKILEVPMNSSMVPAEITPENFAQLILALKCCKIPKAQVAGWNGHKGNYVLYDNGTVVPAEDLTLPNIALFIKQDQDCPQVVCVVNPNDPQQQKCFMPCGRTLSRVTCTGKIPDCEMACSVVPTFNENRCAPLSTTCNSSSPNTSSCTESGSCPSYGACSSSYISCDYSTQTKVCQLPTGKEIECECCKCIIVGPPCTPPCKPCPPCKYSSKVHRMNTIRPICRKTPCGKEKGFVKKSKSYIFEECNPCGPNRSMLLKVRREKSVKTDEVIRIRRGVTRFRPAALNHPKKLKCIRQKLEILLCQPVRLCVNGNNELYARTKNEFYRITVKRGCVYLKRLSYKMYHRLGCEGLYPIAFTKACS